MDKTMTGKSVADAIYARMKTQGSGDGFPKVSRRGTRDDISVICNDLGYKRGVEIGTWRGDHAKRICARIPGVDLTCIDPYSVYDYHTQGQEDAYYAEALAALQPLGVRLLRMTSMEALIKFENNSLDFVHVDGNHHFDWAVMDIICWSRKVKQFGIIAVHDYDPHMAGVVKAVDAYVHCHGIMPWYVTREKPCTAFWVKP